VLQAVRGRTRAVQPVLWLVTALLVVYFAIEPVTWRAGCGPAGGDRGGGRAASGTAVYLAVNAVDPDHAAGVRLSATTVLGTESRHTVLRAMSAPRQHLVDRQRWEYISPTGSRVQVFDHRTRWPAAAWSRSGHLSKPAGVPSVTAKDLLEGATDLPGHDRRAAQHRHGRQPRPLRLSGRPFDVAHANHHVSSSDGRRPVRDANGQHGRRRYAAQRDPEGRERNDPPGSHGRTPSV
jgi:hypothetical protein